MLIYYIITILECVLVVFFGFCVLLMAFTIDIRRNLDDIENKIKSSISLNSKSSIAAKVEIKKNVYEMIRFHADAKQLSTLKIVMSNSLMRVLVYKYM